MLDFNNLNIQDFLDENNETIEMVSTKDVAIIGIAAQLPMADNAEEFWNNLVNEVDCITTFPENRQKDMNKYVKCMGINGGNVNYNLGGYLREIDKFDYKFFKISPKEASLIDPNQRLFLETVWKAIEDGGYSEDKIRGSRTGVYLGFNADTIYDYKRMVSELEEECGEMAVTGNLTSVIASRISYLLDLRGPSISMDTACSSSLVSLHMACQGIRNGDCDMAIAGSVKINILPFERKQKLGIESSNSRARTFDDSSDGTGMGEGTAAVLLKPLSKAVEDKDNIYAVIKGSAINQDGRSMGISAPNAVAQEDVIVRAWNDAGVNPETIGYIEAHGTGTTLGDPIEIDGIQRAFRRYTTRKQFCGIGSVKTNIGHLDNCAGVVGVIKTALSLKHKQIPSSINFQYPNKKIKFEESPVYVNDKLREWNKGSNPRRAGVSAFGLSGTNCHIILEEYENTPEISKDNNKYKILCLSAKSKNVLKELINEYREYLKKNTEVNIQHICYTASAGRSHYNYRLAVSGRDSKEILDKLNNIKLPFNENIELKEDHIFYNASIIDSNLDSLNSIANEKINELKKCEMANIDLIDDLCGLYTKGARIEWEKLYEDKEQKKVSVPTYPFERLRCWIDIPEVCDCENKNTGINKNFTKKQLELELEGKEDKNYSKLEAQIAKAWADTLGFRKINVKDNFYDLGGDSISAMKIVNRLSNMENINISISDLLKHQTIESISAYLEDKDFTEEEKVENIFSAIQPAEKKEYYCLSSSQKRIYVLNQIADVNTSYNISNMIKIHGAIDKLRLQEAFSKLIQKHETLRTSFEVVNGEPVQRIHDDIEINIEYIKSDKNGLNSTAKEFIKPFDLTKAPLIRAALIEVAENENILIVDIHHIVSDGTSVGILIKDFIELYDKGSTSELRIQYKDYAEWQNEMLKAEEIKKQEEYWVNTFKGEIPTLNLPTDFMRPFIQNFEGESITVQLNEITTKKLKSIARKANTTLYTLLLAAYNVLLSKYSGQEDIIIGTLIAGRPQEDLEKIIGMFVNTLAVRSYPEGEKTFEDFLMEVRENSLQAFNNQDYQFEELLEKLDITRDLSRNPLFDTLFVMQNMDIPEIKIKDASIHPCIMETSTTRFDLSLQAKEHDCKIAFTFEYCTKLFKRDTIERLAMHFENIINVIANDTSIKLSQIDMLSQTEINKLLLEFNATEKHYKKELTIHEIFESQVKNASNEIAVLYEDRKISYIELNNKANQLARKLQEQFSTKNSVIALVLDRSIEMIIGIMAVLKAGGAYLPINPDYPEERINYMIQDSGASMVLTAQEYSSKIKSNNKFIYLEDETVYSGSTDNLSCEVTAEDPAYVIYTSGSTGKPKGVVVPHRALNNFLNTLYDKFNNQVGIGDRCLSLTNISFDVSVGEIFLPLCYGGSLALYHNDKILDIDRLYKFIIKNNITFAYIPPTILKDVYELLKNSGEKISLNKMLVGVEPIKEYVLKNYLSLNPNMQIVNGYGPTEATICATMYKFEPNGAMDRNVPIGSPMLNTQIFITDRIGRLQPLGVPGELCIAGDQLAKGYLNREELTSEKFVPNPFNPGAFMYRTGDLAKWNADGNIEFLGRIDNQVKIRGFRIELGEIEIQLLNHNDIKDAIVISREDKNKNKYLCGYIVANREISVNEIKDHLSKELPEYMIPTYFIQLDNLPLTSNGKVNRKMLPEPLETINTRVEYIPPTNEIEEILASIWEEVLGVENIGLMDNFFTLGGDSIKAIQVASRLHKYNMKLDVKHLFQNQTISKISKYVEYSSKKSNQEPVVGAIELTPIQRWFFERRFTDMHHWNQAVMLHGRKGFDKDGIKKVFAKILEHHDVLRAVFEINEDGVKQIIKPIDEHMYDLYVYDLENTSEYIENIQLKANEVQASIDLEKGPLVKLALFNTIEGEYLLISIHHLLVDGISWRIILEDFAIGYTQYLNNQNIEFEAKTDSYKDWAEMLLGYSSSDEILKEIGYWNTIKDYSVIPLSNLISDYELTKGSLSEIYKVKKRQVATIKFTVEETEKLLKEVNSAFNTEINDILLTALGYALREWAGTSNVLIGLEGHGREEGIGNINIKRTVGWFTSIYPVILDMSKYDSIANQIKKIKESLRQIPNKGIGYGILKYLSKAEFKYSIGDKLIPEISFNYLGQFEENNDTDLFRISDIPAGNSISLESEQFNLIDINGIIIQDRLIMNFSYTQDQLARESIELLMNYYKLHLTNIIEYCIKQDENELTPSDITLKDISLEELDEIFDLFED